jgi:hypothetical protein
MPRQAGAGEEEYANIMYMTKMPWIMYILLGAFLSVPLWAMVLSLKLTSNEDPSSMLTIPFVMVIVWFTRNKSLHFKSILYAALIIIPILLTLAFQ